MKPYQKKFARMLLEMNRSKPEGTEIRFLLAGARKPGWYALNKGQVTHRWLRGRWNKVQSTGQ